MKRQAVMAILAGVACVSAGLSNAADLTPEQQAKLEIITKGISDWANTPAIVEAVRSQNSKKPADVMAMTQEEWSMLPVTAPFIRNMTKNAAAEVLKEKRSELITEAFVSDADGIKVAFLAKPTNWSHKGKPKHDVPMTNKSWQGKVELDESTGYSQVQVSVPIHEAGKPIGSLVAGINVAKL